MFDISLAGAAVAGLLSFLSPCILPIVPFYLSYMAGVGVSELDRDGGLDPGVQRRAILASILFAAGIVTVFVGLGAGATAFGQAVRAWFDVLRWVAAGLILLMGLHFLGILRIPLLYRQFASGARVPGRVSLGGAYLIGLAFAFGWTPCVGPVLATILMTAAAADTLARGVVLLIVYGIGMTLPFVLAAVFVGPFLRWMRGFRRHLPKIERAMGALLVLFAVLIGTNTVNWIANWMVRYWPQVG